MFSSLTNKDKMWSNFYSSSTGSSQYYLSLMEEYSRLKKEFVDKAGEYREYSAKLNKLINNIRKAVDFIKSCESNFLGGGYKVNGVSLDNGNLKKDIKKLEDSIKSLKNVLDKTDAKVKEFETEAKNYKAKYDEAEVQYRLALKREREMK